MKKIVILSGAGISKESGIDTFRDAAGMWLKYDPRELASPEALKNNLEKVLEFYNMRRQKMWNADPNAAHISLKDLEEKYDVTVITQNVDDLHERAGSSNVLHLHGELNKVRSMNNPEEITEVEKGKDVFVGDLSADGSQLRPHIVLFGEPVPMISKAIELVKTSDIFIVIGSSLQVYPAAELIDFAPKKSEVYIIDPDLPSVNREGNIYFLKEKATIGLPKLVLELLQ
jgi:NAD-dependent deacetylase